MLQAVQQALAMCCGSSVATRLQQQQQWGRQQAVLWRAV
jgi:hypothetical protein